MPTHALDEGHDHDEPGPLTPVKAAEREHDPALVLREHFEGARQDRQYEERGTTARVFPGHFSIPLSVDRPRRSDLEFDDAARVRRAQRPLRAAIQILSADATVLPLFESSMTSTVRPIME